jgi:iron complex outermembrane recepter protein
MMRRKQILLIAAMASVTFTSNAQQLKGKVVSSGGSPLPGAAVVLKPADRGVYSSPDGSFTIDITGIENPSLQVSFIGYNMLNHILQPPFHDEIVLKLEPSSFLSGEIVVSAIQAKDNTPVAQTNIARAEIDKLRISGDIPTQLSLTPSLVHSSENGTGYGYSSFRIRGTDMSRINVTVNGVPLNDSESQGVFWVNMPDFSSSVENIQIQRGVGTSTNGSAAFGASVNFQTQGLRHQPYAEVSSQAGSFATYQNSVSLGTGLLPSNFAFDARLSKLSSEGWIDRGFSKHSSAYFSGGYYGEKNVLRAIVMLGQEQTGITWWGVPHDIIDSIRTYNPAGKYYGSNGQQQFYSNETDNYWQNHYQLLYSRQLSKWLYLSSALHATTGKGYYENYLPESDDWGSPNLFSAYGLAPIRLSAGQLGQEQSRHFPDSSIDASDMIVQKWLDNVFYGFTASLSYSKGRWDAAAGAAANRYQGQHFGLLKWAQFNAGIPADYEWYRNTGDKTDASAFLKAQYMLTEKLTVFADAQARNIAYSIKGPDSDLAQLDLQRNWLFFNPKFGLFHRFTSKQSAFVSYAQASREPTRADLKNEGKAGADKKARSETLHDFEAGYLYASSRFSASANLFYMLYRDQLVNTGQLNAVGYPIMTNVPESFRRGAEFAIAYSPVGKIQVAGNLALSQNKILNYSENFEAYGDNREAYSYQVYFGQTDISYSPELIAGTIVSVFPHRLAGLHFTSKYVGAQYIDNTSSSSRMLERFAVHGLRADVELPAAWAKGLKAVNLQLSANNIFSARYSSNGYGGAWYEQGAEQSWMYFYPQAGRNYMAKLTASF